MRTHPVQIIAGFGESHWVFLLCSVMMLTHWKAPKYLCALGNFTKISCEPLLHCIFMVSVLCPIGRKFPSQSWTPLLITKWTERETWFSLLQISWKMKIILTDNFRIKIYSDRITGFASRILFLKSSQGPIPPKQENFCFQWYCLSNICRIPWVFVPIFTVRPINSVLCATG